MHHYVNEEALFAWFCETANESLDEARLLRELTQQYFQTRRAVFTLPAERTKSGDEASYAYRYENIGCCGASTVFFYF